MQQQGPNGMGGPLRGTSVWWHGRVDPGLPQDPEVAPPPPSAARNGQENEPMMRMELVNRVRREISEGVYDTPQKWEKALDRLLDRMYRE